MFTYLKEIESCVVCSQNSKNVFREVRVVERLHRREDAQLPESKLNIPPFEVDMRLPTASNSYRTRIIERVRSRSSR